MKKLDHIGIAVKNIDSSIELYRKLLNKDYYKSETVETEGVRTVFFELGESKIELLESIRQDSPIAKFLNKKGEGIHHIAFEVDDIYKEIARLKSEGLHFVSEEPKIGADNKLICFLHPTSTSGTLIELCQSIPK